MNSQELIGAGVAPEHADTITDLTAKGVPAVTILGWVITHGPAVLTTLAQLLAIFRNQPSQPS